MSRRSIGALAAFALLLSGALVWSWRGERDRAVDEPVRAAQVDLASTGRRVAVPVPDEPLPDELPADGPVRARRALVNVEWLASLRNVASPPGTVLVPGGRTLIGSTVEEVEALGVRDELVFPSLVCETPQHERQVDDVFLMVSEVTNEQYAAFVRATDRTPLRTAQAHRARQPAVWVDYDDARAFAEWAGLRLMSEFEYQRACRGDGAQPYAWGAASPDPARCATLESSLAEPLDAGALPGGTSPAGLVQLAGNVWEWTSSPFAPYPGYRDVRIEVGAGNERRTINGIVKWSRGLRVAVGGSFRNGPLAARCTTRRPTHPYQTTDALGFRCAASLQPGLDRASAAARAAEESTWASLHFEPSRALAAERWRSSAGTATVLGYAVIEGYDCVLFVPERGAEQSTEAELRARSVDEPVPLGLLVTTAPPLGPKLDAGPHVVTLHAGALVFSTLDGEPVASSRLATVWPSPDAPLAVGRAELASAGGREPVALASIFVKDSLRVTLAFPPGYLGPDWRY